jgi:Protein of unknown function (DUF4058)
MPLLDHFHPPLSERRHWQSFHHAWATSIATALNRTLPAGYFAEPNVRFGVEIDVAAFEEADGSPAGRLTVSWSPPAPAMTAAVPLLTDVVEVQVYRESGGPTLVGAVEIVSPANKDRPEHRDAFVSKCAALVQQGVGLAVVDVVTERRANMHNLLLARLTLDLPASQARLYGASYRVVRRRGKAHLDVWLESLALRRPLPTIPLWLPGGIPAPVELEATYLQTLQSQRLASPA